ncbi:NAD(P)/FAD-dependent oxidoreductase [Pararcticibacter amylolyticus]|uniref:NADH:ubiquinone reductase (non-electrogenic) n=1 Tax=Pararcticibacter amylolyticus TaxID=2173175 RepID=A0A2U2PED7_9SPHI|nr:NAD(P)/FAD-dependent oxidoreductase [Pararcticibacter amylolyticus]PWG79765.1 FAD-dependent oxidoreductase [Pararcticibacter amylolyticus]
MATSKSVNFPRIIIIGGGFGGIQLAKNLEDKEVQVLMLDRHNYHTFQPLLYQVATGGLEADSIAYPLRKIFKGQKNFKFRNAEVETIFPERKAVSTNIGEFYYDYLVVATGSDSNFFGSKTLEHYTMPMKTIPEALNMRSMILQNLEEALIETDPVKKEALLNFVVTGGGPTGVELAGALSELKRHILPKDYPELDMHDMNIFLVEGSPTVLGPMSPQSQRSSHEFLEELGVKVLTSMRVASYDGDKIVLSDGNEIVTRNVLWSAGVRGVVPEGIPADKIVRGGKIQVDVFNRITGYDDIFAIGDVAAMITGENPHGHPGVAPVAMQQGQHLAVNIVRIINKEAPLPFKYKDKGSMATVGRNRAVVDLGKIRFQGVFAWFVWMFVHLMTLVGFRNKLVVFVNWVWSYFSYDRGTRLIIRPFNRQSMTEDTKVK